MPDQPDLHKPYVREATLEDVDYLSTRLRKAVLLYRAWVPYGLWGLMTS